MAFFSFRRTRPAPTKTTAALVVLLALAALPSTARACACGCGIYEVGTSSMIPSGSGVTTYVDYDYQDQDENWSGSSRAPAADNDDKDIRTSWQTLGLQDMFNRSWGIRLELPYEERHFVTEGGPAGNDIVEVNFSGFGDIRIEGIYAGFSPDLSSGLTFGLKLPSGSYRQNDAYGDVDRDTEIGSGSTDLLLGGFARVNLDTDFGWTGFAQALLDLPVLTQVQYRPGAEFDVALGAYYSGWRIGRVLVAPIGQLKVSVRGQDTGANSANPVSSGFERVLVAPGVEFDIHPVKVYADVEFPLYEHFTGDQMAAPVLFRLSLSYMY